MIVNRKSLVHTHAARVPKGLGGVASRRPRADAVWVRAEPHVHVEMAELSKELETADCEVCTAILISNIYHINF